MMKFITSEKEAGPSKGEGFYVDIDYMYGDADGYNTVTVGCFKQGEEAYLSEFLIMLNKCLEAYPYGLSSDEIYEDAVPELSLWLRDREVDDKHLAECIGRIGFEMEYEPGDWGGEASIEGYNVRYYNKKDERFYNVEVIEDE